MILLFICREIVGYPHLNECVKTLEILNIGGSNVLGEFIPFLLLHTPKLKSLGQWLNTMIYGLEILKVNIMDNENDNENEFIIGFCCRICLVMRITRITSSKS